MLYNYDKIMIHLTWIKTYSFDTLHLYIISVNVDN